MCSRKISIFHPVYRESDLLEQLLTSLINDPYKEKEIFVVIDEPTERSLEVSKSFSGEVHFKFNGIRRGKANVLNEVVSESKGEILLFLDSDTLIDRREEEQLP
jgi:glycosyltransferase involved in cell wall biosynthesis